MKQVYDVVEDFISKDIKDGFYWHEDIPDHGGLNDIIEKQAFGIVIRRSLQNNIKNDKLSGNYFYDITMVNNSFLNDVQRFHDQLFTKPSKVTKRNMGFDPAANKPKNIISLILSVFKNDTASALDKILGLQLIHKMRSYGFNNDYMFNPVISFGSLMMPITKENITVDDFTGINILKMKSTHANICHSLEPFIMLKSEIDKIEDGLWDRLKCSIDRMFTIDDYALFLEEALLFLGMISKYEYAPTQEQVEMFDEFGIDHSEPKPNVLPRVETLLSKYNLDCHCHSSTNVWKFKVMPLLINSVFNMKTT